MTTEHKPHSRQDVTIIRRVLMGEWAKNDSRLTALKALSNLEQQFQGLEEQLETARAAASGLETALEQSLDREEQLEALRLERELAVALMTDSQRIKFHATLLQREQNPAGSPE